MAWKIIWADSALADLEQIVRYIAAEDSDAARRFGLTLISRVEEWPVFRARGASCRRKTKRHCERFSSRRTGSSMRFRTARACFTYCASGIPPAARSLCDDSRKKRGQSAFYHG